MTEIISGVGMFTGVVLALVVLILVARSKLVASGDVQILINDDQSKALSVPAGSKLLNVLADNGVFVSSACGGGGTCAQCKVDVYAGGGAILPAEPGPLNCVRYVMPMRASSSCVPLSSDSTRDQRGVVEATVHDSTPRNTAKENAPPITKGRTFPPLLP